MPSTVRHIPCDTAGPEAILRRASRLAEFVAGSDGVTAPAQAREL